MIEYEGKRYKYPLWVVLSYAVPLLVLISAGAALLLRWIGTVFTVLFALMQGHPPAGEDLQFALIGWMGPWICVILAGVDLARYTEVIVSAAGMRVRVYFFKWVFIPWEDVLGITVTPIPGGNIPTLWRFVQVRRLTCFHRLASMAFLTGPWPVLVIGRDLSDYGELVQIIEEHVQRAQTGDGAASAHKTEKRLNA